MAEKTKSFPKRFLWGAATAAHQVEGKNHNQWSVWELENAKARAAQAQYHLQDFPSWDRIKKDAKDPENYVSGKLADHYHRYKEDFDFLEKMHMNAYRFSIEWSRIEPKEGAWNIEAITHYKEYLEELRRRGIEPIVTLMHFTLPVWFAELGGFEYRRNVKYFVRYAEKIMRELGNSVRYVITFNEPDIYAENSYLTQEWPPAKSSKLSYWKVIHNIAHAHNVTSQNLHSLNNRYKVSITKNSAFYYPGDDAWLSRVSSEIQQFIKDDYIMRLFMRRSDFIGLNYYFSNRFYGYRIHNPDEKLSDMHWDMHPADIEYVLERLHRKYKKPVLITENGVADAQDEYRKWWITETLTAIQSAMKRGVEVKGYLHWSLIDNFEWAAGKWPRFGLVEIDYKTGERTLRPSAAWFGRVIKKLRGI